MFFFCYLTILIANLDYPCQMYLKGFFSFNSFKLDLVLKIDFKCNNLFKIKGFIEKKNKI